MLDKVQLNNQLVAKKAKFQKVKVHVINKLVRKLKKMKLFSDKHPQNCKLKKRMERTTEILNSLKKIKNTEALKDFLIYDKNPTQVIASDKSSNAEVAYALLFSNKICSELVGQIKEVLLLNDDNPGWKEQLLEPSKKEKKIKGKEKNVIKTKDNSQKIIKNKIVIGDESQSENRNLKDNRELETGDTEECQEENLSTKNVNINVTNKILKNTEECQEENLSTKTYNINVTDKKLKNPVDKIKKLEETQNQNKTVTEVKPRRKRRQDHVTVVDPFFITSSGENYLANIDLNPQNEVDDVRNNRYETNSKLHIFNNKRQKPDYIKNNARNGKNFRGKSNRSEDDLHPSWEAKRRNNNVAEFTGKCKSFEGNKLKKTAPTDGNSSEKLHPSWAAKQKLKPSISVFQGTKIVFDD